MTKQVKIETENDVRQLINKKILFRNNRYTDAVFEEGKLLDFVKLDTIYVYKISKWLPAGNSDKSWYSSLEYNIVADLDAEEEPEIVEDKLEESCECCGCDEPCKVEKKGEPEKEETNTERLARLVKEYLEAIEDKNKQYRPSPWDKIPLKDEFWDYPSYPFPPVMIPPYEVTCAKCPVCNIDFAGNKLLGYVCNQPNCPCGLGGTIC